MKYLGLLENVRVRRAGYAHRSTFERFLKRYAMLSKTIWSGKGRGQPRDFCATVCHDLGWTPNKEYCMGKTKLFIQEATTLFALEDALERRQDDAIVTIQRAYKNYRNKRASAVLRSNAYELVNGRKERRRGSVNTRYQGDYISAARNKLIQGLLIMNGPKEKLLVRFRANQLRLWQLSARVVPGVNPRAHSLLLHVVSLICSVVQFADRCKHQILRGKRSALGEVFGKVSRRAQHPHAARV